MPTFELIQPFLGVATVNKLTSGSFGDSAPYSENIGVMTVNTGGLPATGALYGGSAPMPGGHRYQSINSITLTYNSFYPPSGSSKPTLIVTTSGVPGSWSTTEPEFIADPTSIILGVDSFTPPYGTGSTATAASPHTVTFTPDDPNWFVRDDNIDGFLGFTALNLGSFAALMRVTSIVVDYDTVADTRLVLWEAIVSSDGYTAADGSVNLQDAAAVHAAPEPIRGIVSIECAFEAGNDSVGDYGARATMTGGFDPSTGGVLDVSDSPVDWDVFGSPGSGWAYLADEVVGDGDTVDPVTTADGVITMRAHRAVELDDGRWAYTGSQKGLAISNTGVEPTNVIHYKVWYLPTSWVPPSAGTFGIYRDGAPHLS